MSDNKVTLDQLDNSAVEAMSSSVGDVSMLNTENKTIVGALAEIVGKKEIANAIGEPLAETDKFTEMSSEINGLLSTFKTNMMNAGVVVESEDKFKALIDKIKGLTEGEGNRGIQYGEGVVDISDQTGITKTQWVIPINIGFTPTIVLALVGVSNSEDAAVAEQPITNLSYTRYNGTKNKAYKIIEVNDSSITIGTSGTGHVLYNDLKWYAIGVGEEDTTLRDSLASILEEEGVEITEEDDMASLITKVDEEFEKDNNAKDRLYNLMLEGGYDVNNGMSLDDMLGLLELSGISVSEIKQVFGGYYHTMILKHDGSLYVSGKTSYGGLGLGSDSISVATFTKVTTNINNDIKQLACCSENAFIVKNDGSLWATGMGGSLGLGDNNNRNVFTKVTTNINNDVKQVACDHGFTFIIKNDGSVWSCGANGKGQLGLGDTTDRTTFTQVTTNINNDVKEIVCGDQRTYIIKNDGSVWACGLNNYGQLGLGTSDTNAHSTFTQVTTNVSDVKQIRCGDYHTMMLKNDGSVWSCGRNHCGQLGLGDTTDRTTFTQVTTNINNDVKQIFSGGLGSFILKNDGSFYGCGNNEFYELGFSNTNNTIVSSMTLIPQGLGL